MGALVAVCDHAHTHESSDHEEWEEVQVAAKELIKERDMKLFLKLCQHEKGRRFVDSNEEEDIFGEWDGYVKRGTTKYCAVSVGMIGAEEYEANEENRLFFEEGRAGQRYYAAYQQWHAFTTWLETRTAEEQGMVREFEVSVVIVSFFNFRDMGITYDR